MGYRFSSTQKMCSTCAFWEGKREVDVFKLNMLIDNPSATGKCVNLKSTMKGMSKAAHSSDCKYWQKSPLLN